MCATTLVSHLVHRSPNCGHPEDPPPTHTLMLLYTTLLSSDAHEEEDNFRWASRGRTHLEQPKSDFGGGDDEEAVDEPRGGDGGEADEPEPDENVDLLVDDVHRQHAHGVVRLDGAR